MGIGELVLVRLKRGRACPWCGIWTGAVADDYVVLIEVAVRCFWRVGEREWEAFLPTR